jgi:hypothetical protein
MLQEKPNAIELTSGLLELEFLIALLKEDDGTRSEDTFGWKHESSK